MNWFEPLGDPCGLKIGMGEHQHEFCAAISHFFIIILLPFLGHFLCNVCRFWDINSKFWTKNIKEGWKIEYQEIVRWPHIAHGGAPPCKFLPQIGHPVA